MDCMDGMETNNEAKSKLIKIYNCRKLGINNQNLYEIFSAHSKHVKQYKVMPFILCKKIPDFTIWKVWMTVCLYVLFIIYCSVCLSMCFLECCWCVFCDCVCCLVDDLTLNVVQKEIHLYDQ